MLIATNHRLHRGKPGGGLQIVGMMHPEYSLYARIPCQEARISGEDDATPPAGGRIPVFLRDSASPARLLSATLGNVRITPMSTSLPEQAAPGGPSVAVVAAVALSVLLPVFHVLLVRGFRLRHGLRSLGLSCVLYLLAVIATWYAVGLRFEPEALTGGLATIAFFALGYGQVYSNVCRGFSFHMVAAIRQHGALSLEGIYEEYGNGKGVDWLLQNRIDGLVSGGFVRRENGALVLAGWKGKALGRLSNLVKDLLKLGKCG